jgi:hypothetical protein
MRESFLTEERNVFGVASAHLGMDKGDNREQQNVFDGVEPCRATASASIARRYR